MLRTGPTCTQILLMVSECWYGNQKCCPCSASYLWLRGTGCGDTRWQWHDVVVFQDMSSTQTCSALTLQSQKVTAATVSLCELWRLSVAPCCLKPSTPPSDAFIHPSLLCAVRRSRAAAQRGSFAIKLLQSCYFLNYSNRWDGLLGRSRNHPSWIFVPIRGGSDTSAPLSCVQECRRSAAMVETPAGCVFEDIQYEDIEVEAVKFTGTSALLRWATCPGSGAYVLLRICVLESEKTDTGRLEVTLLV